MPKLVEKSAQDNPFSKMNTKGNELVKQIQSFFQEKHAWLHEALEEAKKIASGDVRSVYPQTPAGKRQRKRKMSELQECNKSISELNVSSPPARVTRAALKMIQNLPVKEDKIKKEKNQPDIDTLAKKISLKQNENATPEVLILEASSSSVQQVSATLCHSVKDKVIAYENNIQKSISPQKLQSLCALVPAVTPEQTFKSTLSPVILSTDEKLRLKPVVYVSPLVVNNECRKSLKDSLQRASRSSHFKRNSVVNQMIRSSITRPSLRRSSMLMCKIRASIQKKECIERKSASILQKTFEVENKDDETIQCITPKPGICPVSSKTVVIKHAPMQARKFTPDNIVTPKNETLGRGPVSSEEKLSDNSDICIVNTPPNCPPAKIIRTGSAKKKPLLRSNSINRVSKKLSSSKIFNSASKNGTPRMHNFGLMSPRRSVKENGLNPEMIRQQQEQKAQQALKRRRELLKLKMEEKKKKREERMKRVLESREQKERMKQEEMQQKYEKEQEEKLKVHEENVQKEVIKRSQRLRNKTQDPDKKRKQDEENRLQKLRDEEADREKERQKQERRMKEERLALQKEQVRIAREKAELEKLREQTKAALAQQKMAQQANKSCLKSSESSAQKSKSKLNVTFNAEDEQKSTTSKHPHENYDISDIKSDESTDDEAEPRKRIPYWAQGPQLWAALKKQSNNVPEGLFDEIEQPDLTKIFKVQRKRFVHRTSSAVWSSPMLKPV